MEVNKAIYLGGSSYEKTTIKDSFIGVSILWGINCCFNCLSKEALQLVGNGRAINVLYQTKRKGIYLEL